jgi:quercetin dioxygenase-like cupin family protein
VCGEEERPFDNVLLFIRLTPLRPRPAAAQPLDYTPGQLAMTSEPSLFRWDEVALEKVTEMVTRKVVAGQATSITQVYFKKGALVPLHTRPVEVTVYVLQGAVRMSFQQTDVIIREGEVLVIPEGSTYQAETLDDTFVLVITPLSSR